MNFNRGCFSKIYSDPAFYYTALFNNFPDAEFTKLVCKVFLKKKNCKRIQVDRINYENGGKKPGIGRVQNINLRPLMFLLFFLRGWNENQIDARTAYYYIVCFLVKLKNRFD